MKTFLQLADDWLKNEGFSKFNGSSVRDFAAFLDSLQRSAPEHPLPSGAASEVQSLTIAASTIPVADNDGDVLLGKTGLPRELQKLMNIIAYRCDGNEESERAYEYVRKWICNAHFGTLARNSLSTHQLELLTWAVNEAEGSIGGKDPDDMDAYSADVIKLRSILNMLEVQKRRYASLTKAAMLGTLQAFIESLE